MDGKLSEFLDVGQLATVEKSYGSDEKYTVRVVGWEEGRFIMLELPKVGNSPVIIPSRTLVKCRVASRKGILIGFESLTLDTLINPYQLFFVSYPSRFDAILVRASERLPILISAKLKSGDESMDVFVVDMSEGGLGVEAPKPVDVGSEVSVSFSLPSGERLDELPCEVRRSEASGRKGVYTLGLRFKGENKNLEKIRKFLKDLKNNLSLWRR